ncbi:hypothetical protein [Shewanella sp.]|uniref:toxin-antitoxin system YwqK family antitoxin n=1 Tax=Shewanella sp. TaxID=50422 RepID=UPI003A96BFBC
MRFGLLCLWLVSSVASAATMWLDDSWQPTTKAKAIYYSEYDATAAADANGLHPIKIYYADNKQLRFEGKMKDPTQPADTVQVGPYKFYYANGQLASDGQFDAAGEFSGFTRIFNEDGSLDRTMEMQAGKVTGEVRYFHANGKLRSSYQLVNDIKQGPYQRFAEDGTTVLESGNYKDGKEEGEFRNYYDNGQLLVVRNFVDGKLDGEYRKYRQDGTPEDSSHYRNNELDGVNISYYKNGNKQWESTYKNGELNGPSRYWAEDGKLVRERQYVDGKQNGLDQSWDSNGLLTNVSHFKDGKHVGDYIRYHRDSEQIASLEHYNDQHQLLSEIDYDKDGNKQRETTYDVSQKQPISDYKAYKNGQLVFQRQKDPNRKWSFEQEFDAQGQVTGFVTYKDGLRDGKYLSTSDSWSDDSQIRTEANFKDGGYHGDYVETLLPENIVTVQGRYEHDKKVGEWHYQDQDTKRIERYDNRGLYHGEWLTTTLDDKLLLRQHYQHGKQTGDFEQYNRDGKPITKGRYVNDQRDGAWFYSETYYDKIWHGTYKQGKQIGDWRATDLAGYTLAIAHYDNQGRRQGKFYEFNEDGQLTDFSTYLDNELHGKQVSYMLGEPYYERIYEHGRIVSEKETTQTCWGDCTDE